MDEGGLHASTEQERKLEKKKSRMNNIIITDKPILRDRFGKSGGFLVNTSPILLVFLQNVGDRGPGGLNLAMKA